MTGVSYMIPFVAAGGILIALAFMIGGAKVASQVNGGTFNGVDYEAIADPTQILSQVGFAGVLFKLGATAFGMLGRSSPASSRFAIADRPGPRARRRRRSPRLRDWRRLPRWPRRRPAGRRRRLLDREGARPAAMRA